MKRYRYFPCPQCNKKGLIAHYAPHLRDSPLREAVDQDGWFHHGTCKFCDKEDIVAAMQLLGAINEAFATYQSSPPCRRNDNGDGA